jgi:hypothetical protein
MNPPTLSTLPEDVLDEICGFVKEDSGQPQGHTRCELLAPLTLRFPINASPAARVTLRSLTLTSRSLLRPSRRHLFANPLDDYAPSWSKALALFECLSKDDKTLGRLVRSFDELPTWLEALSTEVTDVKLLFQICGFTKAYSWFISMIQATPSLTSVGLSFSTAEQVSMVISALQPSFTTLREVKLEGERARG